MDADPRTDPYLRDRVVAPLADARARGIELDPRAIAGSDQSGAYLVNHPPLALGAVWDTERAWNVVGKVAQNLAPQRWTAATALARRRADYETRGWPHLQQFAAALSGASTVDAALASAQRSAEREMKRAGYIK